MDMLLGKYMLLIRCISGLRNPVIHPNILLIIQFGSNRCVGSVTNLVINLNKCENRVARLFLE